MEYVRAKILFSDNFGELANTQRRSLILVPRNKCPTVNELKEYIRNKFRIEGSLAFGLSIDGFILPEWENSEIIRENDTLCVFMESLYSAPTMSSASYSHAEKDKKGKKRRKPEQVVESKIEPATKKAKRSKQKIIEEPHGETGKRKKEHKSDKKREKNQRKKVDQPSHIDPVVCEKNAEEDDPKDEIDEEESDMVRKVTNNTSEILQGDSIENTFAASSVEKNLSQSGKVLASSERLENRSKDEETPKRKRRRRRKRKNKTMPSVVENESNKVDKDTCQPSGKSSPASGTVASHVAMDKSQKEMKAGLSNQSQCDIHKTKSSLGHIVFDSDDSSDDKSMKADTLKDVEGHCKSLTNSVSNGFENPVEDNEEKQMDNKKMPEGKSSLDNQKEEEIKTANFTAKNYETYPPLDGPPRNGDIIAFKTLELSADYTPEVSPFKEGKVTNYDHKTQQVDVQLTAMPRGQDTEGEDQRDGRFEMELEEGWTTDLLQEQEATLISTSLSSLMELRLIT